MAGIRLARLPNRTPVKLTIAILPELATALDAYAAHYAETYGETVSVNELVPAMLEAFLEGDRSFKKARSPR
ncbi:DUF2274 domain-containing protein [Sphingomonas colocasiae]|uniref:DUF2274 domain-containing protein n=1 Tax=Sphingomonas colocasiae TaxID=1848973 RepID=A0ABS7PK19_9SPHN|nr:DUF2274 domain-containing protein [Sphingomonas colocasiae]MBY8821085.1 DUF2274 domain-containing protein [Sphingomonas colocasiae]